MTKFPRSAAVALVVGCSLAAGAAHADGAWGPGGIGSSAFGVSANFVAGGDGTALVPVPFAGGEGGWPYNRTAERATLSETLAVAAGGQQIATLQITAGKLKVHAASGGFGVDFIEPTADGSFDSLQITLQLYPAPPTTGGVVPLPLLSVIASGVTWKASDGWTAPKTPTVAGGATFTSATITGSLTGDNTVNITGSPAANNVVVLGDGAVRITVNRQVTAGKLTCKSTCSFAAYGITEDALQIHLEQAVIGTQKVDGNITVGEAEAHVAP